MPPLSQEVHARQYPQWGGGGEAWCSLTSEMVLEYWGRGPTADDLAWVDRAYADPGVDYAARSTYDAAYRGTGNWPFNTAYAARFGLDAFVTQLRSLAEAERFVRAAFRSLPSIAAHPGELDLPLRPAAPAATSWSSLAQVRPVTRSSTIRPPGPTRASAASTIARPIQARLAARSVTPSTSPADIPLPPAPSERGAEQRSRRLLLRPAIGSLAAPPRI